MFITSIAACTGSFLQGIPPTSTAFSYRVFSEDTTSVYVNTYKLDSFADGAATGSHITMLYVLRLLGNI